MDRAGRDYLPRLLLLAAIIIGIRFARGVNTRLVLNAVRRLSTSGQLTQMQKTMRSTVRHANQSVNVKDHVEKDCYPVHSTGIPRGISTKLVEAVISQRVPRAEEKQRAGGLRIRGTRVLNSNVRNARATPSAKAYVDRDCRPAHSPGAASDGSTKCVERVNSQLVPRAGRSERPCGFALRSRHMHPHCVRGAKQRMCARDGKSMCRNEGYM